MPTTCGIENREIRGTPIAVIDLETNGLAPGRDRVVELSVVRRDPGREPVLALDTLVNPSRRVAATEIHGITDEDVEDAPRFESIAANVVEALSDCVVAAYNVYFDIRFLAYELERCGVKCPPPHFCLMYLRPMLGLGKRCKLDDACREHGVTYENAHVAARDALASSQLLGCYLDVMAQEGVSTYADLAALKGYKFVESFGNDPFPGSAAEGLQRSSLLKSRYREHAPAETVESSLAEYWDALTTVIADLRITEDEVIHVANVRSQLGLSEEQVRVLHARAFTAAISEFVDDQWLDDDESEKLHRLHRCLARLGWAPGA